MVYERMMWKESVTRVLGEVLMIQFEGRLLLQGENYCSEGVRVYDGMLGGGDYYWKQITTRERVGEMIRMLG